MSLNLIGLRKTKGMECCARVSSRSWGETSTQRVAAKGTTAWPPTCLKRNLKCFGNVHTYKPLSLKPVFH
jgi:hypothetical protein